MIIDSSAVFALLYGEPHAERVLDVALTAPTLRMSVATWVEAGAVALRRTATTPRQVDELLRELRVEFVPVDMDQARVARDAHRRFGPSSRSRARLNFGDWFSYALAVTSGDALLFVGDDFTHTDVQSALA